MYTCKQSIDLLREYLDGELPEGEATALREHLEACPPCLEFMRSYQATPTLCKAALARQMPQQLAAKLTEFLRLKCRK